LLQWLSYGASTANQNINVLVDLKTQPCVRLDQIRSVYIDNLGSDNPVYVYFPDTACTVVAKPNSEGWYPAYTGDRKFWVIGEGFLTGHIPQTLVIVTNIAVSPAVNVELDQSTPLWKASASITRGNTIYNSNLGVPALGDQTRQYFGAFNVPGVLANNVFDSPYSSGFIYLTTLDFSYLGMATGGQTIVVLESTGIAGILYQFFWTMPNTIIPNSIQKILQLEGLQIKLDATQTWRLRAASTNISMGYSATVSFTTNPN
jgi:hypothetical protein